jgi:hypothetical protein
MAARSTFTRTSGSVITSAWANSLRDHVVPFTGADDVTTEGQIGVNTSTDQLMVHDGTAARTLSHFGAWSSWTPQVIQGGSVACNVTHAVSARFGRLCVAHFRLVVTGGSIGGAVTVSLPVTPARIDMVAGDGFIFDSSAALTYSGLMFISSATVADFRLHGSGTAADNRLGIAGFTAQLTTNDALGGFLMYETVA